MARGVILDMEAEHAVTRGGKLLLQLNGDCRHAACATIKTEAWYDEGDGLCRMPGRGAALASWFHGLSRSV